MRGRVPDEEDDIFTADPVPPSYRLHSILQGGGTCRTGFYLVIAGHPDDETLLATMQDMFTCVLLSTEVPGATEKECGNAVDHDLEGAKKAAREYLDGVLNLIRE